MHTCAAQAFAPNPTGNKKNEEKREDKLQTELSVAKHEATNAADVLLAGQNGGERFKTNAEYLAFLGRHPIAGEQMPPLKRAKYLHEHADVADQRILATRKRKAEREQQQQIIHTKILQLAEHRASKQRYDDFVASHQRNHQVGGASSSSSQLPIPPPPPLPCVQQGNYWDLLGDLSSRNAGPEYRHQ